MQRYITLLLIVCTSTNAAEILAAGAALQKQLDAQLVKEVASLQKTVQVSPAAGQAIASIGELVGGPVGRKVPGFASVGSSLYSNMKLLTASPAALATMGIEPISAGLGIFSGICSLIGLFGDDGDDELAEALNQISKQLNVFYKDTMASFERLEDMLDIAHRQIMTEFLQLHTDHKNIKLRLKKLHQHVQKNHHEMLDALQALRRDGIVQHKEVMNQFATIHLGVIEEKISDVMAAFARGEIHSGNLAKHIHELQKCICITAKNRALTGAAHASLEQSTPDAVRQWFAHPAFDNINIIKEYYTERFGDAGPRIVNPFVFTQCTDALIKLLNAIQPAFASEQEKTACIADIDMIVQEALQALAFVNKVQEPTRIVPLVDDCVAAITTLKSLVETKLKTALDTSITEQTNRRIAKAMEDDVTVLQALPVLPFDELKKQLDSTLKLDLPRTDRLIALYAFHYLDTHHYECYKKFLHWRGKPVTEDPVMYTWLNAIARKMRVGGWGAVQAAGHKELDPIVEQRIKDYHYLRNVKIGYAKKERRPDQPASILIHPDATHAAHNTHVLACSELSVDPAFVTAEKLGLGAIRSFYFCYFIGGTKHFVINSYFDNKGVLSHINSIHIPYDLPTATDEDIVNFWDGGRYIKPTDIMKLIPGPGLSSDIRLWFNRIGVMIPVTPYPPARDLLAKSPKKIFNKNLDKINVMIIEKLKQERIVINQDIIKDLKLASSPMAKAVEALNRRYTMFEAVCALAYNQQFATSPLARHILAASAGVITDKKSFITQAEQYAGAETYAPFDATVQRFAEIKKELASAPFPMLVSILARLRDTRLIMDGAQVVPVVSEADGLRQEVAGMREQMRAQSEQIAQLLKLLAAQQR